MRNVKTIVPIILILVGLGVGFFGGYEYRNYKLRQTAGNFGGAGGNGTARFITGRNGQTGGMMGRNANIGSILSIDANGITVKLQNGSSKIILFDGNTTFANTISASKTDLKAGDNVAVFGNANSDGSVTASSVQINPEFGRLQPTPRP